MRVISTTEELKNYVSATSSFKYEKIAPHINRTILGYIKKLLGEALTAEIAAAYEAALLAVDSLPSDEKLDIISEGKQYRLMPDKYWEIMPYLQDAVTNISFMNCLSQLQVTMSDAGIRLMVNENQKTAFQWQIDDLKYQLAVDGYSALNNLLEVLDSRKTDFPNWVESDSYSDQKKYFVENPELFNNAYYIANNRMTYLTLRYIMKRIEQFEVERLVGATVFEKLKASQLTGYSVKERNLMENFLIPGIVLLTVAKGIKERAIEVSDLGVQANLYTYYATLKDARKKSHNEKEWMGMIQQLTDDGNEFLKAARDYIDANADEFGVVPDDDIGVNFRVNNKPERGIFGM